VNLYSASSPTPLMRCMHYYSECKNIFKECPKLAVLWAVSRTSLAKGNYTKQISVITHRKSCIEKLKMYLL